MTKNTTVLVTGASGFVGIHCVAILLKEGYQVRGTVRSMEHEEALRKTLSKLVDADDRFFLVETDLLSDSGWDKAMQDCDYVLHVASPFPLGEPKDEDDLIIPAREGTLRVLRAASRNGVKRVVQTSSVAAIAYGHPKEKINFDESDWSVPNSPTISAYSKSKTLAEHAAWDFVQNLPEDNQMELATINPGLILGPLPDTNPRTSGVLVQSLMQSVVPGLARMHFNAVDVRDVASAHLAAMISPKAAGQRFICVSDSFWMEDVALVLKEAYASQGYKIKTNVFPSWIVRLVALFNKEARATVDSLDQELHVDNTRIKEVLGWQPRNMKEMVLSMAESMVTLEMI
ncbi:MAG: aldehyde reductase [Anaerolineae bacterium]|jgi:dihydroflavonol-4-reductase|nr:aldehyde reductase [Anaerolineae bacterium]MBT7069434.1 aldehyde reductase [Anaerolineae bacterium]MBT7324367.1 aldehyde reductase [Anaerolineae bacterium]